MPLRQDQRDFIRDEIERQVNDLADSFRPHGWRRVTHFLRDWGLTGTAITVPLALLAILVAVSIFAFNGIRDNTQFRTHTEDRLGGIEKSLSAINSTLGELRLQQSALEPSNPHNATVAKSVLEKARAGDIAISANIVETTGKQFIQAARNTPAAWTATLAFLDYKSSLNVEPPLVSRKNVPIPSFNTTFDSSNISNTPNETVQWANPTTTHSDFAEYHKIGSADENSDSGSGPGYLMITGAVMHLDNWHMKNVVVVNSRVIYDGGPLDLHNVVFVNCTFQFRVEPSGIKLAETLLSNSAVSFSA